MIDNNVTIVENDVMLTRCNEQLPSVHFSKQEMGAKLILLGIFHSTHETRRGNYESKEAQACSQRRSRNSRLKF